MNFPAGEYYIGDLCYVMDNDEWDQLLDVTNFEDGEFEMPDGRKFAIYNTAYGDGEYTSNRGTRHTVDSGTIGCIAVHDIKDIKYNDIERLGAIHVFHAPFTTHEENGTISFGDFYIDTDYSDDEWPSDDEDED